MINTILNGFLYFIGKIFSAIVSPFISGLLLLFPGLGSVFNAISNFITLVLRYLVTACQLLLIPKEAIMLFFSSVVIFMTIRLSIQSFNFFIRVYNKLKP